MDILDGLKSRREQRYNELRAVVDRVDATGNPWSQVDERSFTELETELKQIDSRIDDITKAEAHRSTLESNPGYMEYHRLNGGSARNGGNGSGGRLVFPTMAEYRVLGEGTGAGGGFLVPDQTARQVYDFLKSRSVVLEAGPVGIEMISDVTALAKVASGTSVGMYNESQLLTASDPVFGQTTLTARKAGAFTLASREVLEDSSPSVREVLARDHLNQLALYLDSQFLGIAGNGTPPNMRGIYNFTGATTTNLAVAVTLDHIADALERLEIANAGAKLHIFMSPRDWANLRTAKDTQTRYQLSPDPTQDARRQLFGTPVSVSSQIPTNLGATTNESWILVVDMNQIAIGRRREIELSYSEHFAYQNDQIAVRTTGRFDIQPINVAGTQIIGQTRP